MKLRTLLGLAVIAASGRNVFATTCLVPPPCAAIGSADILFTGVAVGVVPHPSPVPGESWSEARLEISEVFEGMPKDTEEVLVSAPGDPFQKGHSYLIDAHRTDKGGLSVAPCTEPGEIGSKKDQRLDELLTYLRDRKAGKVDTSLTVWLRTGNQHIPRAEVTIAGPAGIYKNHSDSHGKAEFKRILPGHYTIAAALAHYRRDPIDKYQEEVDVLPGTCEGAGFSLEPETAVTGVVRDWEGAVMGNFAVELVAAPENGTGEDPLFPSSYVAKTDSQGRFRFEYVSPGRYLLGSNIIGLNTSRVLPTYYPGQQDRNRAIPVEVKLGRVRKLPPFRLPDYGTKRTIQICVVDENGKSVRSAEIRNWPGEESQGFAGLADDLVTDETGCVKTEGYARVSYRIAAMFTPGRDNRQTRFSDEVVIGPGVEPRVQVLKLTH